jgi:hypothetical protein
VENENQNSTQYGVGGNNGLSPPVNDVHEPPPAAMADVSLDAPQTEVLYSSQAQHHRKPLPFLRFIHRLDVMLVALLLAGGLIFYFVLIRGSDSANQSNSTTPAGQYETVEIPLDDLIAGRDLTLTGAPTVTINGSLQLADTLVLSPSLQPTGAKAGQIYYDQDTNQLAYFNGEIFVFLSGPPAAGVQSLGGATGQLTLGRGLSITNNRLNNTLAPPSGVLSVQGENGDVTFTAGPGIIINGTNFSNSGVLSIAAGSPNVTVTNDGAGNVTIEVEEPVLGTGTVTSSGGTAGAVPVFTADQNIEDSIITQSGLTVTVSGDLSIVTGGLSLSNALTVSNGGTGANSLAANGVLVGQGTSAITSVTAGAAGLCLLSTAGAPTWAACPSASGVNSLNGLSGALSIANASAAGSTITIDDASTTNKGIASFNGTNFTATGGAINLIQNIHTGATPTFAGVNTNTVTPNAALTVGISAQTALLQGSTTTITSNGAGNNIVLNSAGTIELQDNTNVTGNLATTGDLAVNGGDITSTGALNVTPGGALTIGSASQTLTLQGGATTSFRATSGANTTVIGFVSPTANTTLNFPALAAGTYTICTTAGNCSAAAADTLQSAYDNSTSPEIVLDATRGAVTIRDNATPLGANLLEVQNNDGSITFFAVTSTGVGVTGSASVSGDVNSTGGTIQTNGISRIDGTGNLINIASVNAGGNATFQGGGLTLGTNSQAGQIVFNDGSSNTGTLQVAALGQNTVYILPDPGAGSATICLSTGNCAGAGGGITGSGTPNAIPLFTGSQTIGDSIISQSGAAIDIAGTLTLATALGVASGGTGLNSTPTNGQLLIGNGAGYSLATLANNGGLTISNGAGSIGLAVNYGSVAGTAVQGSVSLVCPDGTGNLTGGGNTITLGAGGSCTSLSTVNNPTFTTSVTTPLLASGGVLNITPGGALTVGATSQTALLQGSTTTITSNGAGNDIVLTSADQIRLTGFNCTTFSNGGTLTTDASGNVVCAHDDGGGSAPTFQSVYDNSTPSAFTLNATNGGVIINDSVAGIGGSLLAVQNNDGSVSYLDVTDAGVSVTGAVAATGNINTTGGTIQTGGTTRIDNSGNLTNIGTFTSTGTATLQGGVLVLGTDGQAGSLTFYDGGTGGSAFTGTLQIGTLTQNTVFTLPDPGAGTATICLSTGNCAGSGGGVTTPGGTANRLPIFTGGQTIGDSWLLQNGSTLELDGTRSLALLGGDLTLQGGNISATGTIGASGDITSGTQVRVLESAGGAFYGILDVGDLSADQTFSFVQGGTVVSSGNVSSHATTGVTAGSGLTGGGTTGVLTLNIGAGNGVQVNANDIAVVYGSSANTAVQGNTQLTVTAGTNLTGGGTLTLGSGGSLTVNVADSPTFAGNILAQGGTLTAGTISQPGALVLHDGSSNTGTFQLAALAQNTVYTLPDPGAGTATICLSTGNCAGSGGGIVGSGTANRVAKFTDSGTIGDSTITDDGTNVSVTGNITLQGGTLTAGADGQLGSILLYDGGIGGAAHTTSLQAGSSGANLTFVLPTTAGASSQCLKKGSGNQLIWDDCEGGAGGGTTFQGVYDNSNPAAFTLNSTNGGLTINDAVGGIGAALLAVQNDDGSTTYFDVAATGVSVTGTMVATGNINTSGGAIQTNGTTRIDASGNLSNIGSLTLSGAISGGTTFTGSGNINTTGGTIQTGGTTRIDNSGNLTNIGDVSATGSATLQGGILALGTDGQAGTVTLYDGGTGVAAFTGTLQLNTLGQNTTYNLPDPGAGTATICLSTGNCAGSGGGVTTPNGTSGRLPVFTGAQVIADSWLLQSGSTLELDNTRNLTLLGGDLTLQGGDVSVAGTIGASGDITSDTQLRILESAGGTFYGILDVGDLAANQTFTFLQGGTVVTSGNVSSHATTGVTAGSGLTGGGTTGALTLNIGAGDGIQVNANDIAVTYGSSANTAVEGDTQITVTAGTNLTGGGSLTLGAGGSLTVNVADSPTFAGNVAVSGGSLTVGAAAQAGELVLHDGSGQTGTFQLATLGQDTVYNLPDPGAGTATICLSTGNCAGAGSGVTTPGGTTNTIPLFTGSQTIDDSIITQSGTTINVAGSLTLANALGVGQGGTGLASTPGNGQLLIGNGTGYTLGTLSNNGGLTVTNGAGSIGLAVNYGAVAGTAVQGSTSLICASGSGNLTGGGNTITLGSGGTCNSLSTVNNPTFSTSVTTPLVQNAGLTLAATGANSLLLQTNGNTRLTIDSTGNMVATGNLTLQGGGATLGTTSQTGSLVLHDGNGQTTTFQPGNSTGNLTFVLPTNTGVANQCLKQSGTGNQLVWQDCDGGSGGSSATLQTAYDNSLDPEIVLNSSVGGLTVRDNSTPIGGNLLEVQNNAGSTNYFSISTTGAAVAGTFTATGNINTSGAIQTGGTTRIDASGNLINIGTVSAGTYNGQTISSSANFTGTLGVAGNTTLTGDLAVNGGDLTSSGALNITPGGTLTVGVAGHQLILQGNVNTQWSAVGDGFTTTVGFSGTAVGDVQYDFDRTVAAGTYTICTTIGNCAGAGDGVTTPGGTTGTLAKFTDSQTLGDSLLSESGSTITVNGNLNLVSGNQFQVNGTQISSANLSNDANLAKLSASQTFTGNTVAFQNGANSTNAFNIQNTLGNRVLTVDTATSGGQVVLGVGSALSGRLVFNNVTNNNTVTIVPGTPTGNRTLTLPDVSGIICTDAGNCAGAGATLQTSYNFSTGGTTPKIKVNSTLLGVDIQDADTTIGANLFNIRASNAAGLGSVMLGVSSQGYVTLQNSANDAGAFRLLTQGGTSVLTGDTSAGRVILGQSSTLNGRLVFNNATNANTVTLIADTAGGARTITLPDATGTVCLQNATNCGFALSAGSTSYIQNQNSGAQTSSNFWISGTGRADTSLLAPAFDSASGGMTLGATNAASVTIGKTSGSTPITINSGTGDIGLNTNSASASIIAQSDTNSATAFQVQNAAGQGVLTVNTVGKLVTVNALAGTGSLALDVEGAIQQSGLRTPDSGASPGQWTKLGTCTIDQQFEHCATVLNIIGGYDGALGSNTQATVSARVKQQSALGGAPLVNLTLNDTAEVITRDDLKIVVTQNDGTATVAELWGRININFERWHYAPTINTNSFDNKWVWSPNTAFQAALPAGTQTAARYGNSYANTLLVRNSANSATAFQVQNASDISILTVDATTSRVAIGGSFSPQQALDVVGNVQVRDAATATKSYRLRTSGSALDFEAGGADIIYSAWTGADFTGTQRNYLRLQSGAHIAQAIGSWQFKVSSNGTTRHTIDGTAGADVLFNQNGEATDFTIQGDTAASLFFVDGSADRVGIGTNAPGARLDVLGATTGDAFNVSNSTSTGNIATFKDNNTTVATIADGGATTFQNSADSGDAFRILNSTGGSLMDVDSTNATASLLGLNSGSLSPWSTNTSNPLPVARYGSSTVTANGYVYVIGGNNSSNASTDTVYYAKLNGDGTVGAWNTTATLPAARNRHSSVVANGYVYVVGGEATADVAQSTIYYAKLKHDGTLEAWNTTSSIPAVRTKTHVVVDNGYLYVIGGYNGTTDQTTVYYTRIKADGTLNSSWTTETDTLPVARGWGTTAVMNGYVYIMGGANGGTAANTVYYSKLSASGGVGTWSTTSTLPAARKEASSVVTNGHVYVIGGGDGSPQATVYYSKVNLDGTLGTWSTDTADPLPATRVSAGATTANGYVYMIGGFISGTGTTTVYYTTTSRLQIGASLDLVGLQAQNLAEGGNSSSGSAGGALTAGNGTFVGSLQVQGESQFVGSVSLNRDFNVAGLVVLKNAVNSTEAFQVMNATGVPQFAIDTTNSRIYVGNPTADTTGALLILDSKDDAGGTTADPTGVAGGMYYNVDSGKFRCFENTAWRDCLSPVSRGKYKTANETANNTTYQNDDHLSFTYEANKKYQISGTLFLTSPTAADIKFRWTYSGTGEGFWTLLGAENQDVFRGRTALIANELIPPTTDSPIVGAYHITGTFESTSAGTLQLQWAQNTTSGTTTLYEGGWIELKEFQN